jgi:hypothetical protein
VIRGVNNMLFEEECVFGLFDTSEVEAVLDGHKRGGMFGIVNERPRKVTEVGYKQHAKKRKENEEEEPLEVDEREVTPVSHSSDLIDTSPSTSSSPAAPSTIPDDVARDNAYYKAKYGSNNSDSDDGANDNVNMNLNLNLNFKHGKLVTTKVVRSMNEKHTDAEGHVKETHEEGVIEQKVQQ